MKRLLLGLFLWVVPALATAQVADSLAPDVRVQQIADGVWVHITQSDSASGSIPANGLLVQADAQMVMIDAGWNNQQTALLLDWADRALGTPVRVVIPTHFHGDRTGGLEEVLLRGIRVLALDSTVARLSDALRDQPIERFHSARTLTLGTRSLELFAPGPGHSPDNIVVWLPGSSVLFGGCFVKSADAEDLGNLSHADVNRWPTSMKTVIARYGNARSVVPGHGDVGGRELLTHTLRLLRAKPRK